MCLSLIVVPAHPPTVMTAEEVMEVLPHRYPFLLVDKIIDLKPGEYAVGVKNVTINDNFFPGHFPERAIMPGVLQIEALAQVGGVVMLNADVGGDKSSFFFGGIDKCRFRKPVVPGDTLVLRTELVKLRKRFGIATMRGEGFVNGEKVMDADMIMSLGVAK